MDEPAQEEKIIHRCPAEWGGGIFCKPHRCERDEGHSGPHICNCGSQRVWVMFDHKRY